jgi:EAL domain-containing protein (putative c-di-GMP-specific phosphodiesterase class I)/CheY-like chemotaxis protein
MADVIRVLVADDETVLRAALADLVASDPQFQLVGAARDAEETIALAEDNHPDVAIVDVRMPNGGGMRVAEELRTRAPETRVLAHTAVDDRSTVVRMMRSGAVGYLVKGTPPSEIIAAIKRAARGLPSVSPEVMTGLVKDLAQQLEREEAATTERATRVERIQRVISGEGRTAAFQPIVEIDGGRFVGFESLARFQVDDVDRPVDRWFAEATEIGLGFELEIACIASSLPALSSLAPPTYVSVNASYRTAESDAMRDAIIGVDPSRVVVEITEHEAVEDYERLTASLRSLRDLGVRVAIDDAGAGFASLRHILLIEPDLIKLDVSLTEGIDGDPRRRALASSLTTFADEMGIGVVAEGVETERQLETLASLGVRYCQGYHLGRPQPLETWLTGPSAD